MKWENVPLEEVADITMGQAPPGSSYNLSGEGLPLIAGAGDFQNGVAATKKYTSNPTKISEPGDFILSIRASIGTKVLSDQPYCLGRGVAGLRARPGLEPKYLWHWLDSAGATLAEKGRGATFLQVNRDDISTMLIPLPPIAEQKRIATILDQAGEIRTKHRAQLEHLDELQQSLFHEMFSESDAEIIALGDLAEVTSGITKGRRTKDVVSPVPYLAVANVQAGALQLRNVKQIDATEHEIQRYALQSGDVVMTEGGDPDKLGRGALWQGEIEPCLHQNHVFRVRFPSGGRVIPAYFTAVLQGWETRRYFLKSAKQTTGIASINITQLRSLPVPVPKMSMQDEFLRKSETIQVERERVALALEADNELFAALQYRAFRGER